MERNKKTDSFENSVSRITRSSIIGIDLAIDELMWGVGHQVDPDGVNWTLQGYKERLGNSALEVTKELFEIIRDTRQNDENRIYALYYLTRLIIILDVNTKEILKNVLTNINSIKELYKNIKANLNYLKKFSLRKILKDIDINIFVFDSM